MTWQTTCPVQIKRISMKPIKVSPNALKIAGKRAIPRGFRKKYSPSWVNDCNVLYVKYKEATASEDIQNAANV